MAPRPPAPAGSGYLLDAETFALVREYFAVREETFRFVFDTEVRRFFANNTLSANVTTESFANRSSGLSLPLPLPALTTDTLKIVASELPVMYPNKSVEIIGAIVDVPRIDWASSSNISLGAAAALTVNVVPDAVPRLAFRFNVSLNVKLTNFSGASERTKRTNKR